jgi:hypothetical protein
VAGSFTKDSQSASLLFPRQLDRNFYRDQPISIRRLRAILFVLFFLECSLVVNRKSHVVDSTLLIEGTVNNVPAIILLDTGSREDIKVVREFLRHSSACICRLIRPRNWKPSRCSRILSWYLRRRRPDGSPHNKKAPDNPEAFLIFRLIGRPGDGRVLPCPRSLRQKRLSVL